MFVWNTCQWIYACLCGYQLYLLPKFSNNQVYTIEFGLWKLYKYTTMLKTYLQGKWKKIKEIMTRHLNDQMDRKNENNSTNTDKWKSQKNQ